MHDAIDGQVLGVQRGIAPEVLPPPQVVDRRGVSGCVAVAAGFLPLPLN